MSNNRHDFLAVAAAVRLIVVVVAARCENQHLRPYFVDA